MKLLISNDNGKTVTEVTEWTDYFFVCDTCKQAEPIDYYFFAQLVEDLEDAATITCADCAEKRGEA